MLILLDKVSLDQEVTILLYLMSTMRYLYNITLSYTHLLSLPIVGGY